MSHLRLSGLRLVNYLYCYIQAVPEIMKIVRVQYTTTLEFSPLNQANIAAIVCELKELNRPGIKYGCWLLPDGKTFMHFDQFESEEDHQLLTSLKSFEKFSDELWASGLEAEPKLELLSLVASTD
jgi:hypothetical protein